MTNNIEQKTVFGDRPYIVLNYQGHTLPPLLLTANIHRLGRDRQRTDLVVPDDWRVLSGCHATLQQVGSDYHIYDGDGRQPSTNGLFINYTRITATEGYSLKNGVEIQLGSDPQNQVILTYVNPAAAKAIPPRQNIVSLKKRAVLIGRDPQASLSLDSPMVSRRHASIESDNRGRYILQDYSTNGVFVNQQRVSGSMVLPSGASIQIGPYTLILQGDSLLVADRGNRIRLDVYSLVREVRDKNNRKKRLLDDIFLAIEPGQFVALVGGSGAGKSTLMRSLLGIEPINLGQVNLNGQNLRANFNIYRTQIGYVPQDDIIHRELRVGEVLTYAAKLRLPADINVKEVVEKTLNQIEMTARRDVLVSQLSGGQRKRVSIGVELLADPKLFFLDEPTSGLDPGLDKRMMQLLRKLADQGRTVILVTHATGNVNLCDRIAFMGAGGRLCYFGPPQEAMPFFGVQTGDFADLYNLLDSEDNVVQQSQRFRQSPQFQRYVSNHLSEVGQRPPGGSRPKAAKASGIAQFILLIKRSLKIMLRDRIYIALSLLTAPIAIVLIRIALKSEDALAPTLQNTLADAPLASSALRVLFVFTCAALWVGLSSSVQEIVKESAIYIRERLVNLSLFAYLTSKVFVLGLLAVFQTIFMVGTILLTFKSPQDIPWEIGVGLTTFLTLTASFCLGLLVSAIVKNSSQANSTLPLILLPQIIFSGVLFDLKDDVSKMVSWFTISRWSIGAYGSFVDINNLVPRVNGQPLPNLPFTGSDVYDATSKNINLNLGILLAHALAYLLITLIIQKRKDIL
jgi:ABC transport system ATP-binding/permease protein